MIRKFPRILFALAGIFFSCAAGATIQMAVTVDDLPVHSPLPSGETRLQIAEKMLKGLKKHNVPEVYGFVNASWLKSQPQTAEVLKAWVKAGYPLGNHTYSHPDPNGLNLEVYLNEIRKNEIYLKKYVDEKIYKVFRYPFMAEGETLAKRNGIREFLSTNAYKTAQVTIDFGDWAWNPPYARCLNRGRNEKIEWLKTSYIKYALIRLQRAVDFSHKLFGRDIKQILLLHVGAFDAEMIDELLAAYEGKGVKFIGLTEAMNDEVYSEDPGVATDKSLTFLSRLLIAHHIDVPSSKIPEDDLNHMCTK